MPQIIMPRQTGKATLIKLLNKQGKTMKKHIGTGKSVRSSEWSSSNKVKVTYADFSTEEMTRKDYEQVIKSVKGAE